MAAEPQPIRSETDREIEMLDQLAEVGLDLAKAVAEFTKHQLAQATEAYAPNFPSDPSQAFARLAQTVRRTVALKHHLREDARTRADGSGSAGDLFQAPPKRGMISIRRRRPICRLQSPHPRARSTNRATPPPPIAPRRGRA